ncbi:Lipase 2 [Tolypocladium ophioglossoides CBS 100239]|uniref:Lipase 2 n=1 Tax=Tolypocladium ophioglossoides (strain CBS 100239) TaxID=1163406 RepID=A0A0L0N456_TOLOC|nr:Lipase 2 [Tolypocladium ophioglossoides CBS 100239]
MSRWLPRYSISTLAGRQPQCQHLPHLSCRRRLTTSLSHRRNSDPRIRDLGRQIADEYAAIREAYATPKYPIVLAHGLLGFSELSLSAALPPLQYWHGIKQALTAQGCPRVITASVPPSDAIEARAAKLAADIAAASAFDPSPSPSRPTPVNIIAHSMGGLDARYMISHLLRATPNVRVASLTTISTPHRGSTFADYLLKEGAGPIYLPKLYGVLQRAGLGTKAFAQLTTRYMADEFNPRTVDDPSVRYFSYGAVMNEPPLLSPFRLSYRVIGEAEGPNDGLVSVDSSRWGTYEGTLLGVSHLDLINWPNRVRWTVREWMGRKRTFNAIAFYLGITDMLAKEGL